MPLITMQDKQESPAYTILDTALAITGIDANTSLVASAPSIVQVSPTPAATSVVVQAKLTPLAPWVDIYTVAALTTVGSLYVLPAKYNFVQAVRTGTGAVVVQVQV